MYEQLSTRSEDRHEMSFETKIWDRLIISPTCSQVGRTSRWVEYSNWWENNIMQC